MSSRLPTDEALEKEDRIDEMKKKKKKNSPPVPHLLQAQQAPAQPYAKVVGRPGTGSYPAPSPDPIVIDIIFIIWDVAKVSCDQTSLVLSRSNKLRLTKNTNYANLFSSIAINSITTEHEPFEYRPSSVKWNILMKKWLDVEFVIVFSKSHIKCICPLCLGYIWKTEGQSHNFLLVKYLSTIAIQTKLII